MIGFNWRKKKLYHSTVCMQRRKIFVFVLFSHDYQKHNSISIFRDVRFHLDCIFILVWSDAVTIISYSPWFFCSSHLSCFWFGCCYSFLQLFGRTDAHSPIATAAAKKEKNSAGKQNLIKTYNQFLLINTKRFV